MFNYVQQQLYIKHPFNFIMFVAVRKINPLRTIKTHSPLLLKKTLQRCHTAWLSSRPSRRLGKCRHILRRVPMRKDTFSFRHIRLSVRLHETTVGWEFREISCLKFLLKLVDIDRLSYNRTKTRDTLNEELRTFVISTATVDIWTLYQGKRKSQ
jgi:hypothetical protein